MWRLGLLCLLGAGLAEAQVITTVAGSNPVFLNRVLPATWTFRSVGLLSHLE
jgi:hypothetical protein